jgi:hypothetical protein
VANTDRKTVVGVAEHKDKKTLQAFVTWLTETGSPKSRIDNCIWTLTAGHNNKLWQTFDIRKPNLP